MFGAEISKFTFRIVLSLLSKFFLTRFREEVEYVKLMKGSVNTQVNVSAETEKVVIAKMVAKRCAFMIGPFLLVNARILTRIS